MRTHFRIKLAAIAGVLMAVGVLFGAQQRQERPSIGLRVGSRAPEFELFDAKGEKHSLGEFHGRKNVALVFYPALFRAGG